MVEEWANEWYKKDHERSRVFDPFINNNSLIEYTSNIFRKEGSYKNKHYEDEKNNIAISHFS